MNDSHSLSTRELAQRLCGASKGRALNAALRQIQHWTELGHLLTIGSKNTGTGRSRVYAADELYKALILKELVGLGMRVAELEGFGEFLGGARRFTATAWQSAINGTGDAYLQAYFGPEGAMGWIITGPQPDLKLLMGRNREGHEIYEGYTGVVVLNLRRLFEGKGI